MRLAATALAVLALAGAATATAEARPLYWGAWIGPQLTGQEPPWNWSGAKRFERRVRHGLSILQFSSPFAQCSGRRCSFYSFPTDEMQKIRQHGAIPLFSWNSAGSGGAASDFQLSDLLAGRYDRYIHAFARQARAWGHPFFLRFDWEMNGDWFPWGAATNGNRPGEFKAAWRHVHDIFTAVGADDATWVWCPYAHDEPMRPFYPGNRYVDWTCLDGYNWGPHSPEPAPWRSFREIFAGAYHRIVRHVAPGKPMLIAEVASSGYGRAKATWIRRMFATVRHRFGRVFGLVWFDKFDREVPWPVETSSAALRAFRAGIRQGFRGSVYARLRQSPIRPPR